MQIVNKEISLYQQMSQKIKLGKVWTLLGMTPHQGQAPFVEAFDHDDTKNSFVHTLGRRAGKSAGASITVTRELLIPYSNTILLTPTYRNSKILFDETYKWVQQLKLPITSLNKNQFTIELENGAKFGSFTEKNIEAALGSRVSLLVVDETQSILTIMEILENMLVPMMLDYGVKDNGVLFANQVFLGTPRGVGTPFHELFLMEKTKSNWQSFNAPSYTNPLLPKEYIEEQKTILSDIAYRQEILAEWVSTGAGVFYAFDEAVNLYDPAELDFSETPYVMGLDFGFNDSTAAVLVYNDKQGNYYVHDAYMDNMKPTQDHVKAFRAMQDRNPGQCIGVFGDPSAAQMMLDLRTTYDFPIQKANNKIQPAIALLNELFSPTGVNHKPKLYINKNLKDLILQLKLIAWKDETKQVSNADPFVKHREHHFDLVHALRYAVYTRHRQTLGAIIITS